MLVASIFTHASCVWAPAKIDAYASHGCTQESIMKVTNVATALLVVTALVTVANLLHLPHHAAPGDAAVRPGDKDAALRAEIDALAAAAKAGEAEARKPLTPKPPAAVPAPIVKPPPPKPKKDFAGTTVAIVKPNLYDHGHTFGEFKIFSAIMWGAEALGCETVVVKNRAEAAALTGNVIVVSDQYTDDALKRAVSAKRRYSVDFWGTPQPQVARGTKVDEYLVPYPYPCGNTMIGFRVEDEAYRAHPQPKRKGLVLVLGKEPKYFTPAVRRALDAVAKLDGVKLVATVPRDKARGLPTFIENRGLLDAAGYSKLLGEAQVALGLGDPVLGPGALDALEHGCAVVQVRYPKPRVERWVNPRLPWRTQHDFVDRVGAPWVASVSLEEYPDAVRRALDAVAREPPRSRLPAEYSDAALLRRVEGWLRGA